MGRRQGKLLKYEREIQELLESLESPRASARFPDGFHRCSPRVAWAYALVIIRRVAHTSVVVTVPAISLTVGLLLMFGSGFLLPKAVVPMALVGGALLSLGAVLLLIADGTEEVHLPQNDGTRRRDRGHGSPG